MDVQEFVNMENRMLRKAKPVPQNPNRRRIKQKEVVDPDNPDKLKTLLSKKPSKKLRAGTWTADAKTLEDVETLAGMGLTMQQIAHYYGLSASGWFKAMQRQPELTAVACKGKAKTIAMVSGKLMELVKNGDRVAIIFYLKTQARWSEAKDVEVETPPDTDPNSKLDGVTDPVAAARIYQQVMMGK